MKMVNINIRVDKEIKEEAEKLFKELGINTSVAINMFLVKCINEKGIPFNVNMENGNSKDTIEKFNIKKLSSFLSEVDYITDKYFNDRGINEDNKI